MGRLSLRTWLMYVDCHSREPYMHGGVFLLEDCASELLFQGEKTFITALGKCSLMMRQITLCDKDLLELVVETDTFTGL